MKILSILILALCFAIQTKAQSIDTVKSATLVVPKEFNSLTSDTIYQVHIKVFDIVTNDTLPANSYVQCFDRKAKKIFEKNVAIPYSILSTWGADDTPVIDYILGQLKLTRKQ